MPSQNAFILAVATGLFSPLLQAQPGAGDCSSQVRVVQVRPLDFGTLGLAQRRHHDVQHTLSPHGIGYPAPQVLHRRHGAPAELVVCGPPMARFALELPLARAPLRSADTGQATRSALSDFRVNADGCYLRRTAWDTWDCELGVNGRAILHIGATLTLPAQSGPGTLRTELPFRIVPR